MNSPFVLTSSIPANNATANNVTSQSDTLASLGLAVKDLFHVAGLPTAAGNPDWLATHTLPTQTHSTVDKLLSAGAVFKGKTITDELAYSLHGQNKHYAPLVNPVAPAHIAGGSSSGSAVAVSAHLADIGLGTDTGGSIRVPASYQGLWGLRTTHRAVPCDNMVALAPSFDTVGWMTRDLATLIKVSQVVIDKQTQTSLAGQANSTHSQQHGENHTDLATLTFGVAEQLFHSVAHASLCFAWIEQMSKRTAQNAVNPVALDVEELQTAATFRILQGAEIWQQHGTWISEQKPDIADDIMLRLNWCKTITQEEIHQAKQQQQVVINYLDALFNDIDVLIVPTTPGVAPRCDADETTLANDRNTLLAFTAIAGLAGLPQLHLPLFTLHNAPCGLSIVGKKGSDLALLSLAQELVK